MDQCLPNLPNITPDVVDGKEHIGTLAGLPKGHIFPCSHYWHVPLSQGRHEGGVLFTQHHKSVAQDKRPCHACTHRGPTCAQVCVSIVCWVGRSVLSATPSHSATLSDHVPHAGAGHTIAKSEWLFCSYNSRPSMRLFWRVILQKITPHVCQTEPLRNLKPTREDGTIVGGGHIFRAFYRQEAECKSIRSIKKQSFAQLTRARTQSTGCAP